MSEPKDAAPAEVAAPPNPAAAAAAASYGRSYWDIVLGQFRKNRLAVWSLGVIVLIYVTSVFTPWLANDRPLYFRGTMPGIYAQKFREYRAAAHGEFVRMPEELDSARKRWRDRKVTMKEFTRQIRVEDWHRFGKGIEAAKEKFLLENPQDFKWKTDAVEIGTVRERLQPADQQALDATIERVVGELPGVYARRLDETLVALEVKLLGMARQRSAESEAKAREFLSQYVALVRGGYLDQPAEQRKATLENLKTLRDRAVAEFDPEKATLTSRAAWPVLESLTTVDTFLQSATLMFLVVIPLLFRFTPIARGLPRARKVERAIWIAALPVLLLTAWRATQPSYFDPIAWKASIRDGAIRPDAIVHTPIYFGQNEQDTARKFEAPSAENLFGTDENGRDLLTRMLWGSRISLAVGFVSTGIALCIGIVVGSLAGYFRGWVDIALSRVIELVLCFPSFFIVLAVLAVLPPSIFNVMIVLGIFGWTGIARLARGEFFRLVDQDFVTAGRALGAGSFRLIFRHVLPNSLGPILVAVSFSVASAILTESALSFLGFGVQAPDTSWGSILSTARENPRYYWLVLLPGFAIFLTVTLYNLLGEGIRDAIDPRMRI